MSPLPSPEEIQAMMEAERGATTPSPSAQPRSLPSPQEIQAMMQQDQSWNVLDSVKQFGAGAVRGALSTVGMLGDASSFIFGGGASRGKGPFQFSNQIQEMSEPYLAERDPKYRYSEMAGEFVGPGAAARGVSMLGKAAGAARGIMGTLGKFGSNTNLALDVASGWGAQGATDLTGETVISPIVGAVGARAAGTAGIEGLKAIGRLFSGANDNRVMQTAANALQDYTKLTPEEIQAAIAKGADDPLFQHKTTAEITRNAPMAQLQQELTASGEGGAIVGRSIDESLPGSRAYDRLRIVDSGSTVGSVNREGLGTELVNKANSVDRSMGEIAELKWDKYPRDIPVDVSDSRGKVLEILKTHQREGGLPLDRKTTNLVSQFLGGETKQEILDTGKLQAQRRDALKVLRDNPDLAHTDRRLLAELAEGADEAVKKSVSPDQYAAWVDARDATSKRAEIFGQGKAGGSLIDKRSRPSQVLQNSFKGDTQGVNEVKAAIQNDPQLLEKYKRGVLDLIKTDSNDRLTANKIKTFLEANEGGIKSLYGEEYHANLQRVLADMQSENMAKVLATQASERQSPTAQKLSTAGAITRMITSKMVPGVSGPLASVAEGIRESLGNSAKAKVEKLLLKAVFDPEFAAILAGAPTEGRVMSVLQHLKQMISNTAGSGVRAGALGLASSGNDEKRSPFLASQPPKKMGAK